MQNYETLRSFEGGVAHFERLFRVQPEALAYDLHPDYLATRYALARAERSGLPAIGVQHHHAHVVACMAEHGMPGDQPVIGVSFDGTGYGDDGAIWGGEFLLADYSGYRRFAHLAYAPLAGGDLAVRQPWRLALAWLAQAGLDWAPDLPPMQYVNAHLDSPGDRLGALRHQIESGLNAPPTSSMGRLFDAVSALVGVRATVNYEAQAAIEFEALADPQEKGLYHFEIPAASGAEAPLAIDPAPLFQAALTDLRAGSPIPAISARFHNGVAHLVQVACRQIRAAFGAQDVALSGGVWQNITLLDKTIPLLEADNFNVYIHHRVPTNDGGLALGQAMVAARTLPGAP
jgi:hydrogenase maturation protein HypF